MTEDGYLNITLAKLCSNNRPLSYTRAKLCSNNSPLSYTRAKLWDDYLNITLLEFMNEDVI
jgi:hypothetical protein